MEEYIITSKGVTLKFTTVMENSGRLYVYVNDPEENIKTVFDALYANDGDITVHRYGEDRTVSGYVALESVRKEPGTIISASLRRGES